MENQPTRDTADRPVVIACVFIALYFAVAAAWLLQPVQEPGTRIAIGYMLFGAGVIAGLWALARMAPLEPGCQGQGCQQGRTPELCDCGRKERCNG